MKYSISCRYNYDSMITLLSKRYLCLIRFAIFLEYKNPHRFLLFFIKAALLYLLLHFQSVKIEHFKQHKPLISEAWKLTIITSGFKWAENIISTVTTCIMKFQWFLLAIFLAFATICSIEISIWIFKWAKIDFCCFSSCNSWKNVSKIQNDQK